MTRPRPAEVRFYVDADLLGLAHTLAALRSDVTFPGDRGAEINKRVRPSCLVISPHVRDEQWISVAGNAGWVIITRDRAIQDRPGEIAAVRLARAKMVNLTADTAGTTWGQLEVVMRHWRTIEGLHAQPGPYIYRASLSRLTPVHLSE